MRVIKAALVALVLSVGVSAPAGAGEFEDALDATNRGDFATAFRLWHPLAEQDNAAAQHNLGLMCANGRGVPQDFVQAHMWLNLGAPALTGEYRDDAVEARDSVAADMTPAQIAEAQKLAREWRPASER